MIYCDTSLLVAVMTPEVHTAAARQWFNAQVPDELVVSTWSATEFASALAMKQRRGKLAQSERDRVSAEWETAFAPAARIFDVQPVDFSRASRLVDAGDRGLRAADALHLAIAARNRCVLATLDEDLASAALAIGLEAPTIRTGLDGLV